MNDPDGPVFPAWDGTETKIKRYIGTGSGGGFGVYAGGSFYVWYGASWVRVYDGLPLDRDWDLFDSPPSPTMPNLDETSEWARGEEWTLTHNPSIKSVIAAIDGGLVRKPFYYPPYVTLTVRDIDGADLTYADARQLGNALIAWADIIARREGTPS